MNVTIQNACKAYEGRAILDQFDLEFPQKGTICLLGPSGCGKTTLLNCIAGLEMLDSGAVLGIEDRKIAYMFQEDRLLPWISARENVEVILNHPHIKTAERWLEAVGLKDDMEKRPAELSGGMRQRVALARALAFGGEIFLLDEPFRAASKAHTGGPQNSGDTRFGGGTFFGRSDSLFGRTTLACRTFGNTRGSTQECLILAPFL